MKAYRVGLTGGLGSGKSTIAGWMRDAGCVVIDADRLVADLYRPGGAGAAAVRQLFGPAALTPDGAVDHAAVAARVFADDDARRRLEAAVHPLVRHRFEDLVAQVEAAADAGGRPSAAAGPLIVVLEATLLVEAGYGPGFDVIVTVEADPDVRLHRAVARGLPEASARARLAAQGDGSARLRGAHRVIDNSGDMDALRHQFQDLLADLRHAAASPAPARMDTEGR